MFAEFSPSIVSAPPRQMRVLMRLFSRLDAVRPWVRFTHVPAGRPAPRFVAELERTFAAPVVETFGCPEMPLVAVHWSRPNAIGHGRLPLRGIRVASIGGELTLRGRGLFSGYVDDPELTRARFVDGWFRTGLQGNFPGARRPSTQHLRLERVDAVA